MYSGSWVEIGCSIECDVSTIIDICRSERFDILVPDHLCSLKAVECGVSFQCSMVQSEKGN
jgi:hypothetical protein